MVTDSHETHTANGRGDEHDGGDEDGPAAAKPICESQRTLGARLIDALLSGSESQTPSAVEPRSAGHSQVGHSSSERRTRAGVDDANEPLVAFAVVAAERRVL